MDTALKNPIPMEWIDRIFELLELIYKDKWRKLYSKNSELPYIKTMWRTGMYGVSSDEIKTAIQMCECFSHGEPPTHIEFYHYAKRLRTPYAPALVKSDVPRGNPEVAKQYLAEIKQKIHSKVEHGTAV